MESGWIVQIFATFFSVMLAIKLTRSFLSKLVRLGRPRIANVGRQLGKFEESMVLYADERNGTNNTCYLLTLHSKVKLQESLVRDAVVRLAKRQPMLRAVIRSFSNWFGEDEKYFEIIKPSEVHGNVDVVRSDVVASKWDTVWYEIITRPLRTNLQWQVLLFKEEYDSKNENYRNTIAFRVNHCIVDGVSGMKLCDQFLEHLNNSFKDPLDKDASSLKLFPSLYEVLSKRRPWSSRRYLETLFGVNYIYSLAKRIKLNMSLAGRPDKPFKFFLTKPLSKPGDLMYKVFSKRETSQIHKICKANGATVTGALMASVRAAFRKLIETSEVKNQQEWPLMFAVNGLRFCEPKPPAEYIGNFVISSVLPLWAENGDFWSSAQEATQQIQAIVNNKSIVETSLMGFDVNTPRELMDYFHSPSDIKKFLKLFGVNYVSSCGKFTIGCNNSTFKLHDVLYYGVLSGHLSFSSSANVTVNGKMAWVVMCHNLVPCNIAEQFSQLCFDILVRESGLN